MKRLPGLDALRGIAALMVVFEHTEHLSRSVGLFSKSYLAVDLFFMLSGFVMARSYESKMANGMSGQAFTVARLRRLWPTMAVGSVLGLIAFSDDYKPLLLFALGLVFVPRLVADHPIFPQNPPAWSILFELAANCIHTLVLRRIPVVGLGVVAVTSAATLIAFASSANVGWEGGQFWLGIPRVLFSYCVGIILWRALGDASRFTPLLGLVTLPAYVLLIKDAGPWADFFFVFALCPLIVISGLGHSRARILQFFGAISFPLYAVHYPILVATLHSGVPFPLAICAAVLGAWAVWRIPLLVIERSPSQTTSGSLEHQQKCPSEPAP